MYNDNVKEMYAKAREAFRQIEYWDQDRVNEVVAAVALNWMREDVTNECVKLASEASGMGRYDHKQMKHKKIRGICWDMKDAKTAGIMREDRDKCWVTYAKPMGVVANVVPCTNPTITTCHIGLSLLKTRNAMICSPHPKTKLATYRTVQWGRAALKAAGAPEDLFLCIEEPSSEKTVELMATCDFAVATGGKALIKHVHAAGTPNVTVGAGNVRTIIDPSADLKHAAYCIHKSKTFDNSTSCSSENAISIHTSIYDKMMEELKKVNGYMLSTEDREKLRKAMWPDGHSLNRDLVATPVSNIAKLAGISVPEGTEFIMVKGEKIGPEDMFSNEKMSLVLTVWTWEDFETELKTLLKNLEFSGIGHSACLHSTKQDQWHRMAEFLPLGRVNINAPNTKVNSGSWYAAQEYTTTLACGTWTGNNNTDNVNYRNFMNETRLGWPFTKWESCDFKEYIPTDEEVFGRYLPYAKKVMANTKLDVPMPAYTPKLY